jgi:hypothetical protein
MKKTIRPDGSLDPIDDFEDDGASFRVRREAYLAREFNRARSMWSRPRNSKEAVRDGLKIGLLVAAVAVAIPLGIFLLMIVLWATGN